MALNYLVYGLEKYGFMIILLFCFGFFAPSLTPKLSMMTNDASAVAEKISGSNITKQAFWLSFFGFYLWRLFQDQRVSLVKWEMLLVLLFAAGGLALISILWSEYPALTFKRAFFQIIFCFSIVSSFYFSYQHDAVEESLFWGGVAIVSMLLFSIIMGVAFTSGGNLAGFTKGKNLLGQNLLVFIALLFIQIKIFAQRLPYTHWLIGVLFIFLLLTVSKTSIALLILFLILGHSNLFITKLATSTFFAIAVSAFIFIPALSYFLGTYIHLGLYLEPDAITGRGIIWDTLYYDLEYFSKLFLGYGYGAYFSNGTIPYFFDDDWSFLKHIASSHNGYLDILIQYGLLFSLFLTLCLYKLSAGIKHCWLSASLIIPIVYNVGRSRN